MLVARISNPYGPGQNYLKGVGFIDAALKRAIHGETIEVWGNGDVVRDYIYIDDVCRMLYDLVHYHGKYEIFNLSSNTGTSQNDVLDIILLCVSIIVVAIPEGLPLAVTLSLAFSISKVDGTEEFSEKNARM